MVRGCNGNRKSPSEILKRKLVETIEFDIGVFIMIVYMHMSRESSRICSWDAAGIAGLPEAVKKIFCSAALEPEKDFTASSKSSAESVLVRQHCSMLSINLCAPAESCVNASLSTA